jgi:2,4-dienoyl-CoA reductase-like NADH-dependent reductase (Old Yellow Enzyme family)/thioredoxin reductase
MHYTHVHTPIRLGKILELKNRVVRPAHATNFGNGLMNDRLIAYHEARAAGGVGLSIIEICAVHESSPGTLRIYEPGIEKGYRDLVAAVRPHGMKLFQQLWHAGHASPRADGGQPWSASDIANPRVNIVPIPMTKTMIDDVVAGYARTARLMEDWGMDGVDVHAAHGYLIHQFLSPVTNVREDDYGGTTENRMRFLLEVMRAIRSEVSPDFTVGIRFAPDETVGGIGVTETSEILTCVEEEALIDYVNISMGSYHSFAKIIGGMHEPAGYELATSAPVARASTLPTMVIGRFRTLEEADQVIRSGDADMVGMVRATIADPDLVNKSLSGRVDDVRPCIGCNQACAARPTGVVGCAVNPAAGHERTLSESLFEPVTEKRHVVVVGGGPAGLEAARVAAVRGYEVTLLEAQPKLGGALRLAGLAPSRQGFADILEWLERQVYALGVDVRLSSYVSAEEIAELNPDLVIVATGSMPRMDGVQVSNPGEPIEGFGQPHVISSQDLFTTPPSAPEHAVVIDDLGHYEAIGAAEYLIRQGASVDFVTRHYAFAPLIETAHMTEPALARLDRGEFTFHPRSRALRITADEVEIGPTYDYLGANVRAVKRVPADTVVFVSANRSINHLVEELGRLGIDAKAVGDAFSPRFLESATREGRLAALVR